MCVFVSSQWLLVYVSQRQSTEGSNRGSSSWPILFCHTPWSSHNFHRMTSMNPGQSFASKLWGFVQEIPILTQYISIAFRGGKARRGKAMEAVVILKAISSVHLMINDTREEPDQSTVNVHLHFHFIVELFSLKKQFDVTW